MAEFVRARHPARRCAYCHAALTEAVPCEGCGAAMHPECAAELGGCVTVGCARRAPASAEAPRVSARAASPDSGATYVQGGALVGLFALAALGFVVGGNTGRRSEFLMSVALKWAVVGAIVGGLFGALFGAAMSLVDSLNESGERRDRGGPRS